MDILHFHFKSVYSDSHLIRCHIQDFHSRSFLLMLMSSGWKSSNRENEYITDLDYNTCSALNHEEIDIA